MQNKSYKPLSASEAVGATISFDQLLAAGKYLLSVVKLPEDQGRATIIDLNQANHPRLLGDNYDVKSKVHEYGGAPASIKGDYVYFVNKSDQQIYCLSLLDKEVKQITNYPNCRFADLDISTSLDFLVAVLEDHSDPKNVLNSIVQIQISNGKFQTIANDHDFFAAPRIKQDQTEICYLAWDHPNMPWDGCQLYKYQFSTKNNLHIAGSNSIMLIQPEWQSDNLYYFSDQTNWTNLCKFQNNKQTAITSFDFDLTSQIYWQFGISIYSFNKDQLYYFKKQNRQTILIQRNLNSNQEKQISTDFADILEIKAADDFLLLKVTYLNKVNEIVKYDLATEQFTTLLKAAKIDLKPQQISLAQSIDFKSAGQQVQAFFYPAVNQKDEQLPALKIKLHGGPTSRALAGFNLETQFWTSHGFSLVDINYRGSCGFGRKFRQLLNSNWGIVDVEDAINAAIYLIKQKLVDPKKIVISGGSAGGYTTLAALVNSQLFAAAGCYYGVADLTALTLETHKFESHYLDNLIGEYPAQKDRYDRLSPIKNLSKIHTPIIFFHGDEDKVVPLNQSKELYQYLMSQNIKTDLIVFKGEGHGFTNPQNKITALEAELKFYQQIFATSGIVDEG